MDPIKFINTFQDAIKEAKITTIPLISKEGIDQYVAEVTQAISIGIERSTPWKRQSPQIKPFWITEYQEVIKSTH